jgi:hypothetical protein
MVARAAIAESGVGMYLQCPSKQALNVRGFVHGTMTYVGQLALFLHPKQEYREAIVPHTQPPHLSRSPEPVL